MGIVIALTFASVMAVLFLGARWHLLLCLIPFAVYGLLNNPDKALQILCIAPFIPLAAADIQLVRSPAKFKGLWNYLLYLPSVLALIIFAVYFPVIFAHGSFANRALVYVFCSVFMFLIVKAWFTEPLLLFVNRLKITDEFFLKEEVHSLTKHQKGKALIFYLDFYISPQLEINGLWYYYLKFKNIQPKDTVFFTYKKGWLGVEFVAGLPGLVHK